MRRTILILIALAAPALAQKPNDVQINVGLDDVNLGDFVKALNVKLPVEVAGRGSVHVKGVVPLDNPGDIKTYRFDGTIDLKTLTIDRFEMRAVKASLKLADGVLTLENLTADVGTQGKIAGRGELPLDTTKAGRLDLTLTALEMNQVTKLLRSPVPFEGVASGTVALALPPAEKDGTRPINGDVNLTSERLLVRGVPARRLKADVKYHAGVADYTLKGEALGGTFEIEGKYPSPNGGQGRLRIEGVRLGRLAAEAGFRNFAPLRGRVDVALDWRDGSGSGRASITRLRWNDRLIAEEVRADLRVANGELRVRDIVAPLGGGGLRGQVVFGLQPGRPRYVNLTVDDVDAGPLLAPFFGGPPPVEGSARVQIRGRIGDEMQGSGSLSLERGRIHGVAVREAHLPFTWRWSEAGAELRATDATAQIGNGRVTGELAVVLGTHSRIDGWVRFLNVDLHEAVGALRESRTVGGLATGRLTFRSDDLRSADNLTATLDATLAEAQPFDLPVLREIAPFVLPGRPRTTLFAAGDVRATLARGIVRLQRLALTGDFARLYMEGTATLAGRLDLNVVAATNVRALPPSLAGRFGLLSGLPLSPAQLIAANNALAGFTVRLHVGGTFDVPSVQVDTAALIREVALRYLLLAAL